MSRLLLYRFYTPKFSPIKELDYSKWLSNSVRTNSRIIEIEEDILYTAAKYGRIDIIAIIALLFPGDNMPYCIKVLCYTGYYFNFIRKSGDIANKYLPFMHYKIPLMQYAIMGNQWDMAFALKGSYHAKHRVYFSHMNTALGNRALYNLITVKFSRTIRKAAAKLINIAYKKEIYPLGVKYIEQWNIGYDSIEF